jgi:transcription elongation factor Elf1
MSQQFRRVPYYTLNAKFECRHCGSQNLAMCDWPEDTPAPGTDKLPDCLFPDKCWNCDNRQFLLLELRAFWRVREITFEEWIKGGMR